MRRKNIERWKGGNLRVFRRYVAFDESEASSVPIPSLVTEFWDEAEAVPYGRGLAMLLDPKDARPRGVKRTSGQLRSGLWIDIEVREGRPQCVAVRSDPEGPEISPSLLRFALDRAVSELIRRNTVRLELDSAGEVIGVLATSPESAVENRTIAERTADLRQRYERPKQRRGRRPLSEEHLREVLDVAQNAIDQKQPASIAIAERWNIEPTTARQWLYKARKRSGKEKDNG